MQKTWRQLALVVLLIVPARAAAQDDYFTQHADKVMERLLVPWKRLGFEPVTDRRIGVLRPRDRDSITVQLEQGWQYAAVTMCDEDCGDVDLHLYDSAGAHEAFETTSNARSLLRILSPKDGTYRLEVVMMKCSTPPCYYAVQLLRSRAPAEKPR
jgi:hypothetical protein